MAEKKSLVEDAILQMKNLEEAIAENAKGILASTMGQEIKELVKESLNESNDEEEVEEDADMEVDMTDMSMDNEDSEEEMDSDEDEMESDEDEMDSEEEMDSDTIDLTKSSDEDVLKVFQLMEPTDSFVVTKDESGNIHLKDEDKEYMIVQEGEEMETEMEEEYSEMDEEMETEMDETMHSEMDEEMDSDSSIEEIVANVFGDNSQDEMSDEMGMEETIYEIEMDEEDEMEEEWNEEMSSEMMEDSEEDSEEESEMDENIYESKKMSVKPKGVGIGSPKFKYSNKPNTDGGFKVVKKNASKTMGTGKAKFEYKEGENLDGKMKPVKGKKMETKEAARTYGNGSKSGRGLRKGITPNRNLTFESTTNEVQVLREKNEEYRKALNVFRDKLNEVAVFNSNLAYATRLFTEHSTSKQEKINILRRFDGVESLKESKNLYKQIKDELSNQTSQPVNESIERIVENTQTSGSAVNLIESKTYENPQFLRMKDLMSKLK